MLICTWYMEKPNLTSSVTDILCADWLPMEKAKQCRTYNLPGDELRRAVPR